MRFLSPVLLGCLLLLGCAHDKQPPLSPTEKMVNIYNTNIIKFTITNAPAVIVTSPAPVILLTNNIFVTNTTFVSNITSNHFQTPTAVPIGVGVVLSLTNFAVLPTSIKNAKGFEGLKELLIAWSPFKPETVHEITGLLKVIGDITGMAGNSETKKELFQLGEQAVGDLLVMVKNWKRSDGSSIACGCEEMKMLTNQIAIIHLDLQNLHHSQTQSPEAFKLILNNIASLQVAHSNEIAKLETNTPRRRITVSDYALFVVLIFMLMVMFALVSKAPFIVDSWMKHRIELEKVRARLIPPSEK
jgi:hypothetical protein